MAVGEGTGRPPFGCGSGGLVQPGRLGGRALAEVRRRLSHVRALRTCAVLAAAIPFATLPVATLAAASYTVDSNLDYPKSAASGPLCQSTAPGNPCTLRAAIQTANIFGGTGSESDVA